MGSHPNSFSAISIFASFRLACTSHCHWEKVLIGSFWTNRFLAITYRKNRFVEKDLSVFHEFIAGISRGYPLLTG
jgi:hypothetical protein